MRRSTVGSGSWLACSRRRSRVSSVTGSDSGTWPTCCTRRSWRRCSISSVTRRPMSCPCSASSSIWTSAPAVSRSTIVSQRRKSESSSIPPTSWSTSCTEIGLAGRGGELVERRDRVAERAVRAARDERERRVGRVDALALAHAPQDGDELLQPRPLEDERLAARAHGRQHAREVGRAEDEDEVGRRLLDQLQERVPRLRGQLVRLVDDVDLVAALDRLQHGALADLADVVDAALRGGVHLDHVERGAVRDRPCDRAVGSKSAFGPPCGVERLGEDARQRGLPGPARPGERYACRTWSCSIAFRSVRTTASWPITWPKSSGR